MSDNKYQMSVHKKMLKGTATEEDIIKAVYDWFVTKGNLQSKSGPLLAACSFRGFRGAKCAVGCLIPDRDYRVDMEKWGSSVCLVQHNYCKEFKPYTRIMSSLQSIHDNWNYGIDGMWEDYIKSNIVSLAESKGIKIG